MRSLRNAVAVVSSFLEGKLMTAHRRLSSTIYNFCINIVTNLALIPFFSFTIEAFAVSTFVGFFVGFAVSNIIPGYELGQRLGRKLGMKPNTLAEYSFCCLIITLILPTLTTIICNIAAYRAFSAAAMINALKSFPVTLPIVYVLLFIFIQPIEKLTDRILNKGLV